MRMISLLSTKLRFQLGILAASLLLGLPAQHATADPVAIANASFELPDAGGAWIDGIPDSWLGPAGLGGVFVESAAAVGFSGADGVQYGGLNDAGTYLYQDLGVPFAANTRYTIDIAGAHRSGFSHGTMQFGLWSSDALESDLGTPGFMDLQGVWTGSGNPDGDDMFNVLRDASAVSAIGSGALGNAYTFTTGGSVPTGNLVVFIRDATGNRINFDNVRLDATVIPEPASVLLLAGCAAMLVAGRKRK